MLEGMPRDSRPPFDASGDGVDSHTGLETVDAARRRGEADLIRRCRLGERAAFERLYREHRRPVAANLYRVLGERAELEDLVQEVFVIAFRGLDRFRGEAKLSTWLYRICVNVALGRLRSRARRPPPAPYAEVAAERADGAASPEARLADREELARVARTLDLLSPKKRIVFVLHEIEGLDIDEIAEIVRAPRVTVRTRLHYARKEFYRRVAAEGGR
jgi:RNA polymerase sigma-70 factor (ECF subfamily)